MPRISGNTKGIRASILSELETLYDYRIEDGQLITAELAMKLAAFSTQVKREAAVYCNRAGKIVSVSIGDVGTVDLPPVEGRRGAGRLSGLRCFHTHPGGSSALSGVDISALKNFKLDCMLAIGAAQDPAKSTVSFAVLDGCKDGEYHTDEFGPLTLTEAENIFFPNFIATIEKLLAPQEGSQSLAAAQERAVLVGMDYGRQDTLGWTLEDSVEELKQLADTAGALVVAKFLQKRPKPDPAYFIGRGKVRELALFAQQEAIDLVIFDDELSPAQQRNLEQAVGVRVLDRTALILDIFAQRARTNEGKLQVELAQLQYTLPRIMGKGQSLSRLGGGIGTRGPGETKLEVDRRRIRERIDYIKGCIEKVKSVRDLHRAGREKSELPTLALIGYTNAGKSTLLNTLCNDDIYAKDQLFATLDPTTRQLELPDKRQALLTDTVGFIQRLPHQLVAAFRSTLEEVTEADLLLHVIDVSHSLYKEQSNAVYQVLKSLGATGKPIITVYNKIDKLPEGSGLAERLAQEEGSVCISAKKGLNLNALLETAADHLRLQSSEESYLIPYSEGSVLNRLHDSGTVLSEDYLAEGTLLKVRLPLKEAAKYAAYLYEE